MRVHEDSTKKTGHHFAVACELRDSMLLLHVQERRGVRAVLQRELDQSRCTGGTCDLASVHSSGSTRESVAAGMNIAVPVINGFANVGWLKRLKKSVAETQALMFANLEDFGEREVDVCLSRSNDAITRGVAVSG